MTADSFPWICSVVSTGLSKRKGAKLSVFSLEFLRFGRLAGHGLPSLSGSKGNSWGKIFSFAQACTYVSFLLCVASCLGELYKQYQRTKTLHIGFICVSVIL